VGEDGHEVVKHAGDLAKESSDPFCSLGDVCEGEGGQQVCEARP
jgi:hypothetical protein